MHSQLGIEIARIFLLVSSYWILPTCSAVEEAERAELELRVLSQPDSVGSQGAAAAGGGQGGAVAMVHIGATLRGLNSAISPDERCDTAGTTTAASMIFRTSLTDHDLR